MAYGIKYKLTFKNRQGDTGAEDIYYLNILQKDFEGAVTNLQGASAPFLLKYQSGDGNVLDAITGIRASECEVNYWNDGGLSLSTFYSDDDEEYRFDFYCFSVDTSQVDKLLWSGYLVQDNCQEQFAPPRYVVTLSGTDNLGLLKEVSLDTALTDFGANPDNKVSLYDIVRASIAKTGIELPLRVYTNVYENTTNDRGDDTTVTFLEQTVIHTGTFKNDEGEYEDCYSVLEKILFHFNASLSQANGFWNIVRFPEANLFENNQIAGTDFPSAIDGIPSTTTLDPNVLVDAYESGLAEVVFINANHITRINRPFKDVKLTFNYYQPKSLIINNDLGDHGVLINSFVDDDGNTIRDYELPDYWKHLNGDTSFIRIITDPEETELEKFVYQPKVGNEFRWVRFNPIEVTAGDSFDFTLQLKHVSSTSDNDRFTTRFILVTTDGQYYVLTRFPGTGSSVNVHWNGPFSISVVDTATNVPMELPGTIDDNDYTYFSLSNFVEEGGILPAIPVDGMLLIDIAGTNETNMSFPNIDVQWKEFAITFTNRINESTKIIGQYHLQNQDNNAKNRFDEEIYIDDSPRNTIAGTLFTNAITTFGADIGDIYFTRTLFWHRAAISEAKRLGQITSYERKLLTFKARTVLEGDFFGLRYFKDDELRFMTLLNFIQVEALPYKHFVFGLVTFDYMNAIISATLHELYEDDDEQEFFYTFKYISETT